jgi:uncharacterized protein YkwD
MLLMLLAALTSQFAPASPDLVAVINGIREQGCGDHAGVKPPLRTDPLLDRVAEALASGRSLREAMMDAGYRAVQSAELEVSGSDAGMARTLADRGCKDIVDPVYRDVGIAERVGNAWIVMAAPLAPPTADEAQAVGHRVLDLVNEARARPRRCGWKRFDAAAPLVLSETLQRAAHAHARDMTVRSRLDHAGGDGSTPGERATRAGYRWRVVGENIAAGQSTPEQVVAAWLRSARHCANLMSADFSEMGVAYAFEPQSAAGIYWAQMFATPRPAS